MTSILQKNGFIRCPNCSNLISSFSPSCSKCGLLASEDGVMELALIDEQNLTALSDADSLLNFAASPFMLLLVAVVLAYVIPPFSVTLIFFSAVCIGVFWWKYFGWGRNYLKTEFPDVHFHAAQTTRKKARILGVLATGAAIFAAYFTYLKS